jgi:ribonucleoside-diphosphate reductase alpha chain
MNKIENIIKRDGREESFNVEKIIHAISKAWVEVGEQLDKRTIKAIASDIQTLMSSLGNVPTVEDVQDAVELKLADKYPKIALAYAKYRTRQEIKRTEGWGLSDLGKRIYEGKYRHDNETFEQFLNRTSNGNSQIRKRMLNKQFLFGGRILANRGLQDEGRKVTFSNCYVLPSPKDNLESIFEVAKEMGRTFSYGGGVGISLDNLRPKGMKVNNSAMYTSGAVSFMDLYSTVTSIIGQKGRRGALMIAMSISHPDVYDFLKAKSDLTKVTSANISLKITNDFMDAVQSNDMWLLSYTCVESGEIFEKEVHAKNLFTLICKHAWSMAEPGVLFWDTINNWHLMNEVEGYKFSCTNPCGEIPLMDYGACLLGSINLSAFVTDPFTDKANFDINGYVECIHDAVVALNEVLDENIPLHPLQAQRDYARDYRNIGLGIMGLADMLLMMNYQYGSKKAVDMSKTLAFLMINESVLQSAMMAKEKGAFPKCDKALILKSEFVQSNIAPDVQKAIEEYGLYNASLLAIAPTGSLSTMWDISGGIEPIFMSSYTRKIESIGEGDEYYKVITPVVRRFLEAHSDMVESNINTAINTPYMERIAMQSAWQQFIDSSISSTINLPESATVSDIEDIYMKSWMHGLKGVTVYRDKCDRSGILSNHSISEEKVNVEICEECSGYMIMTGGCKVCVDCGASPCSI